MKFDTPPQISVVIPTYNGSPWVAKALDHLSSAAGGLSFETIVVDNASTDDTVSICQRIPGVQVIKNGTNRGFSNAVNTAVRNARSKHIVLINQDLYLGPESLRIIDEFLSKNAALAGGELQFENGRHQPSFGPFPTLIGTLWRFAIPKIRRKNNIFKAHPSKIKKVDWLTGAFIAFPKDLFESVGGLSEDYFMYYEDVDFCMRAQQLGFSCYFLPSAKATHVNPHSSRREVPDWLRKQIRLSQVTYFKKHRPRWEYGVTRFLNRAYFILHGWQWP